MALWAWIRRHHDAWRRGEPGDGVLDLAPDASSSQHHRTGTIPMPSERRSVRPLSGPLALWLSLPVAPCVYPPLPGRLLRQRAMKKQPSSRSASPAPSQLHRALRRKRGLEALVADNPTIDTLACVASPMVRSLALAGPRQPEVTPAVHTPTTARRAPAVSRDLLQRSVTRRSRQDVSFSVAAVRSLTLQHAGEVKLPG